MRSLFRILSMVWTVRAASRGPGPLAAHMVRRRAHRSLNRMLR